MLYQERYSSAYLSQAQSSLVQWGPDGKLRTILDTIVPLDSSGFHPVPWSVFVLGPPTVRFDPFDQVPPGIVGQAHRGFFRLSRRLRQVIGDQPVEVVVFVDGTYLFLGMVPR